MGVLPRGPRLGGGARAASCRFILDRAASRRFFPDTASCRVIPARAASCRVTCAVLALAASCRVVLAGHRSVWPRRHSRAWQGHHRCHKAPAGAAMTPG